MVMVKKTKARKRMRMRIWSVETPESKCSTCSGCSFLLSHLFKAGLPPTTIELNFNEMRWYYSFKQYWEKKPDTVSKRFATKQGPKLCDHKPIQRGRSGLTFYFVFFGSSSPSVGSPDSKSGEVARTSAAAPRFRVCVLLCRATSLS